MGAGCPVGPRGVRAGELLPADSVIIHGLFAYFRVLRTDGVTFAPLPPPPRALACYAALQSPIPARPTTTPSPRRRCRTPRRRYIIKSRPSACMSDMRPGTQRPSRPPDRYPLVGDRRTSRRPPSRFPAPDRLGFGPWCSVELTLSSPCQRGPHAVPQDCRLRCLLP